MCGRDTEGEREVEKGGSGIGSRRVLSAFKSPAILTLIRGYLSLREEVWRMEGKQRKV